MRTAAAFLLALFLGQALGLPALEGPCVLAQCANEGEANSRLANAAQGRPGQGKLAQGPPGQTDPGRTDPGQTSNEQRDCSTPCAACLCCGPIRTLPPLGAATLTARPVTPAKLLAERDTFLPDSPPHEILHVPKA